MDLRDRALQFLRDWRETHGNEFVAVELVARELGCEVKELFGWDREAGVYMELADEDLISVARGPDGGGAIATGQMEWGAI